MNKVEFCIICNTKRNGSNNDIEMINYLISEGGKNPDKYVGSCNGFPYWINKFGIIDGCMNLEQFKMKYPDAKIYTDIPEIKKRNNRRNRRKT